MTTVIQGLYTPSHTYPPTGIMIIKLMAAIEYRLLLLDVGNFHLGLFGFNRTKNNMSKSTHTTTTTTLQQHQAKQRQHQQNQQRLYPTSMGIRIVTAMAPMLSEFLFLGDRISHLVLFCFKNSTSNIGNRRRTVKTTNSRYHKRK